MTHPYNTTSRLPRAQRSPPIQHYVTFAQSSETPTRTALRHSCPDHTTLRHTCPELRNTHPYNTTSHLTIAQRHPPIQHYVTLAQSSETIIHTTLRHTCPELRDTHPYNTTSRRRGDHNPPKRDDTRVTSLAAGGGINRWLA